MVRVAIESADQPDVARLIDELDAYQKPLYPAESHHGIDLEALAQPNVFFAVAREDGRAVGCGAIVVEDGYAELKRMYVRPQARGKAVARTMLAILESKAFERGIRVVRLETGFRQPEALRFYQRAGYAVRGPFGRYTTDPNSVFMEKEIAR